MATDETLGETAVDERGAVAIPEPVRRRFDIEPGDRLRWSVDRADTLSVEVVGQHYGAFDDDDTKADLGGDGSETHDLAGREHDFPGDM